MKKAVLLFIFISGFVKSQNLVPNWSFENYTVCPSAPAQLPSAVPWIAPTSNSSDYYNGCALPSTFFNVPYADLGFQFAKDGLAYVGLYFLNGIGTNYREYIQIKLNDSLTNNKCYYVEFYTSMDNNSYYAVNNIAANFSPNAYSTSGTASVINAPTHITKYNNPIIKDTLNWVQIAGIYSASGGEKYVTIGNFKDDVSTNVLIIPSGTFSGGYYLVDAVSVYSINPTGPLLWSYPDANVNIGDSVYIGNTMGGSFSSNWYTVPGNVFIKNAPGLYVKPVTTSTYVVTFTLCGVPHSDTLKVTVTNTASVNEIGVLSSDFVLSPNPNNGSFQINILNDQFIIEESKIRIVDILGEEIKKEKLIAKKQSLDVSNLSDGLYFLQLIQNDKIIVTKKIIKN